MDITMNSLSNASLMNITADGNYIQKNKNENIEGEEDDA
jgi:hypothetical protein